MVKHSIATLGSHSALDVCEGAKQEGFKTVVVAEKGREKTYLQYYRTRKQQQSGKEIGIIDEVILVNSFKQLVDNGYMDLLKSSNAIFVPNRSFAVYLGYDNIENNFKIPIFGNKYLLRAEERAGIRQKDQYYLMQKAGVHFPKKIMAPQKIDRLVIVKVNEAKRSYERSFFLASSYEDYLEKSNALIKQGKIKSEDLKNARIEEFVLGAQFNFNFFYSPINEEIELLGIDTRRQTNIEGFLRLPAKEQTCLKGINITNIEVGHIACTIRESLLEQVFENAEKLVKAAQVEFKPGIIGPFALQAMIAEAEKEELVCFDLSFRIPGSPGTRFTPYSGYLFRENMSYGRRIAMEIKYAEKNKKIEDIVT